MKYIVKTLDLIDYLSEKLNISFEEDNRYASIISKLVELKTELVLNNEVREKIYKYLEEIEVPNRNIMIYKLLYPNTFEDNIDKEVMNNVKEQDLSDELLIVYLTRVLRSVSYLQKGDLLLLKYSKIIWEIGWSKLARQCRGKVINIRTREIVSYPFNKFFNLDEVEETKQEKLRDLLEKDGVKISVTDKKDGSAIIVSKYNGEVVINTNGEFDNIQVTLAKKLLEDKYSYFYNNIPNGYTFVFELIHPDNKIVIDYGNEEKLYLLAVRDLENLELKTYSELIEIKEKYKLDITEAFEYTDLSDFLDKALSDEEVGKEGWVFSIKDGSDTFMFKLKFKEYFKLSRLKNKPSLKKVYTLLLNNNLDDVMAEVEDGIRTTIEEDVKVIYNYIDLYKKLVIEESVEVLEKLGYDSATNENMRYIAAELKSHPFANYILKYYKGFTDLDVMFEVLPKPGLFEKLYNYTNDKYKLKSVDWDTIVL